MARTGYKITVYLDDNPNSSGYMETYEERVLDENTCPISEDDLVLVSSECEVVFSGKTGYRINTYYNRTTGEYQETKELDPECEASTDEEIWVPSGDPFCETTELGVNTGYMVQIVVQENRLLPNYGETKQNKWLSPECGANNCAIWDDLQQQCHISVANCVATFDGTADVTQIDINPLSATYNQTRTINKQDSNCENCTQTTFSWQLVGDMCGNDELLCSNGLQQVATNSYTVHRKYKTIGNSTPVPMDEYQIVLKIEDDEDCGYIRPQYEMRRMPGEYLCDFETYTKYEKYSQYVSYDSGVTWSLVSPEVSQRGDVIAYDSYDCGKPMYRWVFNGEYTCEDNGDDGKIIYWDSNSVMVSAYTCDETDYIGSAHVSAMTGVSSGITSPDGYKDCYQIGDCVTTINGLNNLSAKIWLGNYTEKINSGLGNYRRSSLDIPERVNYIGNVFPDNTSHTSPTLRTLVLHPMTPPTLSGTTSMPIPMKNPQSYKDAGIFVPYEAYDDYLEAWSTYSSIIKPMNNDTDSFKAIIDYESDFTKWRCFVPDGESASTISQNEWIYGRPNITSITLTNKVITVADDAFYKADNYSGMYNLKSLNLGNSVETIGYRAFKAGSSSVSNVEVSSLVIPESVRSIGDSAFEGYPLTSLTINNGVETIGDYAFFGSTCSAITLPDSVKTIGSYAFYNDSKGLIRLEIGSGCTSIGRYVAKGVGGIVVKALTPPTVRSDSFGTNLPSEILVPCESYTSYVEQWYYFANKIAPYGCSGVEVTIAILHQTDGTDIEITNPIEYRRKILKPSDIDSYSSTTSAITVTEECTEFAINSIYDYSSVDHITFEGVIPPEFTNLSSSRFVNNNQVIYVPCEGYDIYRFELNEVLTSWDDTDKLVRINDSCVGSLEYEWVCQSRYCNAENGKTTELQTKYLVLSGVSYQTVETREVETTTCLNITNNSFTYVSNNKYKGCNYATMDFEYLLDGGLTVTIEQQKGGRPYFYVLANTSIYDNNGTLVATTDGHGTIDVELESNKKYHVTTDEVRAGGCGGIKFNF